MNVEMKIIRRKIFSIGILILVFTVFPINMYGQTTYNVSTNGDGASSPSNGSSPYAITTLRGALTHIESNSIANAVINLPNVTITLGSELEVAPNGGRTIQINGHASGTTINGQNLYHIFNVDYSASGNTNLTLTNLTLTGGHDTNDGYGGGAILGGTGFTSPIDNLTLSNCTITSSTATSGPGGAISWWGGTMSITNCTFSNNSITAGSSTGVPRGGAIHYATGGNVTITNSTFSGNSITTANSSLDGTGGGLYFSSDGGGAVSSCSITNSTFFSNTITSTSSNQAYGGAVTFVTASPSVTRCSFISNSVSGSGAARYGGAIFNGGNSSSTITYSRFSGNSATTDGGAIRVSYGSATANDNWWGSNSGPSALDTSKGSATLTATSYLQLQFTPARSTITTSDTTLLTADIFGRNTGGPIASSNFTGLASFTSTFGSAVLGTLSSASTTFANGKATVVYTAGSSAGSGSAQVTGDNQSVTANIAVTAAPTATTNAGSSVTSSGATLNGTVNANNASTVVTFEYGTTTGYGSTTTATQSPVTGTSNTSVSKAITGLSANTLYHYRVKGVNSAGTTNGLDATFTTSNNPPTAANNSVTFNEDNDKTFAASEFNYTDPDGSTMSLVQIVSLPSVGTLYKDSNLNGVIDGGEALSASATVTKAVIDSGKLKFKPAANATGSPYTTFTFKVNDGADYSVSSYTMTINVGAVNDPPTAANNSVAINEDNDKTFASSEFNYSDTEGSTMSLVQITGLPSVGTLYNDANLNGAVDGGETLSTSATVTKTAIDSGKLKFKPAANGNGSPYTTFTFKVNDGTDYSNSSFTMTIDVTPVVDVTFTDGSSYTPPSALPSTNNNPIGRLLLTGDISGASLSALTVTFVSTPSGVTVVKLWSSSDNAYDSGTDTQVSSTTVSGTTALFSSFSSSISSSGTYYFVTVDLNSGASGTIEPIIANNSNITITSGGLVGTITNAALSNGGSPLPVELTSFNASSKRLIVELQWKTATEVNNYGFEVEKSTVSGQFSANSQQLNTNSWFKVGFIEGSGTSSTPHEYSFTDKNSLAGKYLYRLKQTDRDGKFSYSQQIEVETGAAAKVFELSQNFPNPFNPTTAIEFTVPEDGLTTLKIYDVLGREVATLINEELKAGMIQQVEFNASHLSSGIYFARLQFKEHVQMKRMMLVK